MSGKNTKNARQNRCFFVSASGGGQAGQGAPSRIPLQRGLNATFMYRKTVI
jgi:hypothetical protein